MNQKSQKKITPSNNGLFGEIGLRLKLILRLMADGRINLFYKLIPIAAIVYFFMPDLVLGPIDDGLILWFASYLFVELCPQKIVDEHMRALRGGSPNKWDDAVSPPDDVIDAEFSDLPEAEGKSDSDRQKTDER
jgi:hypothetical protein